LLADPDRHLRHIASWLGLRKDAGAIDEMKHPENSPFARFGPRNALLGNDPHLLRRPTLRSNHVEPQSLDEPLDWRKDGAGFLPKVKQLAREFGYE
jgi:hypothetical protein